VNPRYRETFNRNRRLFLLPVVLGAVVGLTFGLGSPKLYRSDATLAFKSLDTASSQFGTPPAAQNQAMLNELLATHGFPEAIARRSPLQQYLRTHDSTSWTPTALLKRFIKGKPTLDDRITEAFSSKRVTSIPSGSDLLEVSFAAPDPVLAQQTLRVIIGEFMRERTRLQGSALTAAIAQFTKANSELKQAQTELKSYSNLHPGSTTSGDPELATLNSARRQALGQVKDAANVVNTAMAAVNGGTGLPTTASVFDEARLPVGPTTGKKRVFELIFVGGFVGALISFLAIMYLSRPGREEAPLVGRPAALAQLLPEDDEDDEAVPEHERAAQLLADQRQPRPARSEPPVARPAALAQLLPGDGEQAAPEHDRAAELLAEQEQPRRISEARRE
jgi:hypothetical protein